jgi:hypothetical protein
MRPYSPSPFVRNHALALRNAGAAIHDARNLLLYLCTYVPGAATFDDAVALAAAFLPTWNYQSTRSCVLDFLANANHQTGAQWAQIGNALGANRRVETTLLARLVGWNHASILQLAQAITAANPNNFPVAQWIALSAVFGPNTPNRTTAFARIPGWDLAHITSLANAFLAANPNNFTAANWAALAGLVGADQDADATTLARLNGWNNFAAVQTIAQNRAAGGGNPNNLSVADWAALASILGANGHAETTAFARITSAGPAPWSFASIQQLAQAFVAGGGNPNNFSAAQWAQIAAAVGANQPAHATAFARVLGAGHAAWNHASALQLAQAFTAGNANNLTGAQWILAAAELPANQHADVATVCRVRGRNNGAWNAASIVALLQARNGGNANGFTIGEWVAIAAVLPANQHANTATFANANQWAHADVVTLGTRFVQNAYGQTAADWITVGNRMRGGQWAVYTERAMRYRQLNWPDQVMIRTAPLPAPAVAWHLEASIDGVIYRRTGTPNPHLTLHQVDGGPNAWRQGQRDLHVVRTGPHSPWDYKGRGYDPFLRHGQVRPVPPPEVTAIVDSFCTAMGF